MIGPGQGVHVPEQGLLPTKASFSSFLLYTLLFTSQTTLAASQLHGLGVKCAELLIFGLLLAHRGRPLARRDIISYPI
jgi:hypothetical protein